MTLRTRLVLLASAAVALAVLAASVAAWFLIRGTLMDEVDQRLLERTPSLDRIADGTVRISEEPAAGEIEEIEKVEGGPLMLLQGQPIGVQRVAPDGTVLTAAPPGDLPLDLHPDERGIVDGETGDPLLWTATVDGASYRVMSAPLDDESFLRLVHPLEDVENALTRMAWLLVGVAGVGVAIAGGAGWVIVRAGLRPVDRLTEAAEQVAATNDLAHRIDTVGHKRDEVARLARSVNTMLAALDDARTEQRQLVENAGHELRTPLATLRNDIGVLIRAEQHPERELDAKDRADLLRDLDLEAAALSDMVAELVDLARGEVEPEPLLETDLRALVDRAIARTRRIDPRATIDIRGASFEATVRPAMLERAIANLLRNAVQVSDDAGLVEVNLAECDGWATVRVLDRGPGIAEHDLPRLFERFYRGDSARGRHGSGLGLAIVAQAAEQHGGSADAANRDGGGAVFTLRIPARQG
ncbi:HAMP domain-containing sensor histidine kinase [Phytoactinopolyspora mesophila]|uniref:histidine kinase n=1 Tax=Phytoactinopolyspora mesophila TaxID=2650750 RepID=A0A7K3M4X3_9ACTN|nr:HAMP domain-containing sensor histidine kinase [Phytoactinopolyspora mesophila]NDL58296.1 HAMP domain-containing protein [Phytoactinopolyspora mesophila]